MMLQLLWISPSFPGPGVPPFHLSCLFSLLINPPSGSLL